MPAWLIAEFVNLAPLTTGSAAMLEPAPTWQLSQAAVVGTWFAGIVTIEKPIAGMAYVGAVVGPWHCVQLPVVLGAYRWMFVSDGTTEKLLAVWQSVHSEVGLTGMWLDGYCSRFHGAVTEWHELHSAVVAT